MQFIGNLLKKVDVREGSGVNGPWKVASFLLQTVEMYPKKIVVDVKDGQTGKIAQWDAMIGQNVTVQFDIDAHEYNGRWFNSLKAWAIKGERGEAVATAAQPAAPAAAAPEAQAPAENDGLPF